MKRLNLIKTTLVLSVITVLVVGCAAPYNTKFPMIEKGMFLPEVESLIGDPISAESGPEDTKILYYRLASSPLDTDGSDTREYFVLTKERKVLGYGERRDEVTMQRDIRQFNAAWNAARIMAPKMIYMKKDISVDVK